MFYALCCSLACVPIVNFAGVRHHQQQLLQRRWPNQLHTLVYLTQHALADSWASRTQVPQSHLLWHPLSCHNPCLTMVSAAQPLRCLSPLLVNRLCRLLSCVPSRHAEIAGDSFAQVTSCHMHTCRQPGAVLVAPAFEQCIFVWGKPQDACCHADICATFFSS